GPRGPPATALSTISRSHASAAPDQTRRHEVRNTLLFTGAAVLALTSVSYAQNTNIVAGGPHDLSNGSALRNTNTTIDGQTCVFCHTPHGGSNSIPLWNRSAPT